MPYLLAHPFISLIAGFGLAAVLFAWLIIDLRYRWRRVFGAGNGRRDALGETLERLRRAESRLDAMEPRIEALEEIGKIAVQKVGFMRFNPFEHTGGDQSFAIALLDRKDNGIVLSSLYTREGVRVYAKEIQRGNSRHPLSGEEQKVLEQALSRSS